VHSKAINPGRLSDARLISDQRAEALTYANHVRQRRAALKRRVKTGEKSISATILDPPGSLHTARVEAWVMATPGLGKVKSHTLCREVGIRPTTTIGRLTDRQRALLAANLTRLAARRG
jgi:hypothetical protein